MSCKASRQLHGAVEGISGIGAAAGIHVGTSTCRSTSGRAQMTNWSIPVGRVACLREIPNATLNIRDGGHFVAHRCYYEIFGGAEPLESRNLQEGRGFGPDHSLGADLGDRFRLSSTATRISGSNVRYRPSPLWPRPFRSVRTTACHPNRSSRRTSNPISSAPPTS